MKLALMLVVFVVSIVFNAALAQADAGLSIAPWDGDANPKVVQVSTATTKHKSTATFNIYLGVPADNEEEGIRKVTSQTYTLTSTGGAFESQADVVVDAGFTVSKITKGDTTATITKTAVTVDANGQPDPNGAIDWTTNTDGNFTVTASVYCDNVSGAQGDKTIELSGSASYIELGAGKTVSSNPNGKVKFTAVKVEIKTPHGDPTQNAGAEGANNTNELSYGGGAPECIVLCEAEATALADKLRWTITDVGGIKAKWNPHVDGDEYVGIGLNPIATYPEMPLQNSDFGAKTITLTMEDVTASDTTNVEIFFAKTATNHPDPPDATYVVGDPLNPKWPNWMFYWMQTVTLVSGGLTFEYGPPKTGFYAGTTTVVVYNDAMGSYSAPYGVNNPLNGIDTFAWTMIHESQHYADWVTYWGNDKNDWFDNHKGKNGPDDDLDGDRIPNKIEDVNGNGIYDAGDLSDWQILNTPTVGRDPQIINDFEEWDCKRHTDAKGDHSKDWANPGFQHQS